MQFMKTKDLVPIRRIQCMAATLLFLLLVVGRAFGEATPEATADFNRYVGNVESSLARQHRSSDLFIAGLNPQADARLRQGEFVIEKLTPQGKSPIPGAMLHHWRGTAFVPKATVVDFQRLMRDFNSYPQHFSPQVVRAKVLSQNGDHLQAMMRVRQHHVITVVMDTTYDVTFGHLDPQHAYSLSRSTQISEISSPGTSSERALSPSEEHGFLWRLNSYWSCEERDGGLYMQIESVSLTRAIPMGLGWAVGPFVESVPRESLEFTLHSTAQALRKQ